MNGVKQFFSPLRYPEVKLNRFYKEGDPLKC